jgi:hypothetical protein
MLLKKIALSMLLLSGLLAAPRDNADAAAVQKELIWSQSDGLRYEIYASSLKSGAWTNPVKVTDDNANNLHPALAVAPDGTGWAFWSAVNPDGISIKYAVAKDGKWSDPAAVEMEDLSSAITPSALVDKSGVVWLVWAGNDGGQDEIYCSRYVSSAWQKPERVNTANEVPDIKPAIALNTAGQIEVKWEGVRNGKYVPLLSTYAEGHWSSEQQVEKQQEEVRPELPEFVPADSKYSLKTF